MSNKGASLMVNFQSIDIFHIKRRMKQPSPNASGYIDKHFKVDSTL